MKLKAIKKIFYSILFPEALPKGEFKFQLDDVLPLSLILHLLYNDYFIYYLTFYKLNYIFFLNFQTSSDPICCISASEKMLLIGRESGVIQSYSYPQVLIMGRYSLPCRPHRLTLNCNSTSVVKKVLFSLTLNNKLQYFLYFEH